MNVRADGITESSVKEQGFKKCLWDLQIEAIFCYFWYMA